MWYRTRRRLIGFAVIWFLMGTGTTAYVWKCQPVGEFSRTLAVFLFAATLLGTCLPLMVLFDDWRLHRH